MKWLIALMALALLMAPLDLEAEGAHTGNVRVMDTYLQDLLVDMDDADEVTLIVQFTVPVDQVSGLLDSLGLEIDVELTVINGASMVATKSRALDLSRDRRVLYMEADQPLDYFMEVSAHTIGASAMWNYMEIDDGEPVVDNDGYLRRIDGRGVTAVVLDTGIDAGHPDLDYLIKTIKNEKRGENGWTEMENSDTSSGHGTHCAGTVGGNGDASAGARRGVAPGANLYGMSTGEGLAIIYGAEALNRVAEQSRPNDNPYNIRVVSNSWGSAGARYDPEDAITRIIEVLTYENDVAVVFAAGNSGGDGSTIQTNPYSNVPAAIGVAAALRDGTGIADFSSRGHKDIKETWPDIAAPGVDIWSTAPRGTLIDGAQRPTDNDLYYMAISGTSMATPHISGVVTLLYQAAPSLTFTDVHEDYSGGDGAPSEDQWFNDTTTLISEAELILEATADYISSGEGVPSGNWTNEHGWRYDFVQGYGLVNVTRAVEVAMTLETLRTHDSDHDGFPDMPGATVFDALLFHNLTFKMHVKKGTDTLRTRWHGEWAHFTRQTVSPGVYETESTVYVNVPNGVNHLTITFDYEAWSANDYYFANLDLAIDWDDDGNNDFMAPTTDTEGVKTYDIDVSGDMTDRYWAFWVDGESAGLNVEDEFFEPTVNFQVAIAAQLDPGIIIVPMPSADTNVRWFEFGEPTSSNVNTTVYLETWVLDPDYLRPIDTNIRVIEREKEVLDTGTLLLIAIIMLVAGLALGFILKRPTSGGEVVQSGLVEVQDAPVEVETVEP